MNASVEIHEFAQLIPAMTPEAGYFHQHHIIVGESDEVSVRGHCDEMGLHPCIYHPAFGDTSFYGVWWGYIEGLEMVEHARWKRFCQDNGMWSPVLRTPEGYIYFIQCGDDGPIKIGYSISTELRLPALQCASPFPLKVRAIIPGTRRDERELHRRFGDGRLQGEWFRPDAALMSHINALKGIVQC